MNLLKTVRAVALFEAAKGLLVLLTGFGALSFFRHDTQHLAEQLISHLHLNPARHFPRVFLDAAADLANAHLWMLATVAATYSAVRFTEAYGLWFGRRWAEWFAAISGGIYIPLEVYELLHRPTWLACGALAANVAIVGLMIFALRRTEARRETST